MEKTINLLTKIGFSERESLVYMAGQMVGPASASVIAKQAGISRTLAYNALKLLIDRGLVSKTSDGRQTRFIMDPPSALRTLLIRRQNELAGFIDQLPNLLIPAPTNGRGQVQAKIRVYQGIDGLKTSVEDVLNVKSKLVRSLVPVKNVLDIIDRQYLQTWFAKIDQLGIASRSLWSSQSRDPAFATKRRELRLVPNDIKFPATVLIYDHKTLILSTKRGKPISLVIENSDFTETLTIMFDGLWEQAGVVN